jgi:hypothetical protein
MKGILEKPTLDNLQKALVVLEFPKKCVIKSGVSSKDKKIELPITQFFCLKSDYHDVEYPSLNANQHTFDQMSKNCVNGYKISNILEKALSKQLKPSFFIDMAERAKKYLIVLDDRVRLLHKLAQAPQNKFKLTDIQKYFLQQTFPIILVSEDKDKIALYNFSHQEYRSISRLKLGTDIKIIATDTTDHRLELMKFLELHQIYGVQIVLFDDLKKSKSTEEKPSEPYHHEGGVPTLKWLCAKQCHLNKLSIFKDNSATSEPNSIYSEKNVIAATNLIEDDKKYSAIDFVCSSSNRI